ncbi:hypothetical protein V8G54_037111 [Vigna mungo]|uniref:Protein kinase domain-containing protein n=1 Tax=Vigna mungo TaxID=3915 RepID=A0AAQ3MI77_VIGMU
MCTTASSKGERKRESSKAMEKIVSSGKGSTVVACFGFRELATTTRGFKEVNLIGEGGFGRVYKGRLSTRELATVKQLSHDGQQDKEPLSWSSRMKIVVGAAHGLEYLHCKEDPPVIYKDLKSAIILLDNEFNPKLSYFWLAKLGPFGYNTHVSTRVMGTYGYCARKYAMSGKLTLKSDIYNFCVVLLELITGRRAIDASRNPGEKNSEQPKFHPLIGDIVVALECINMVHAAHPNNHLRKWTEINISRV